MRIKEKEKKEKEKRDKIKNVNFFCQPWPAASGFRKRTGSNQTAAALASTNYDIYNDRPQHQSQSHLPHMGATAFST
jgi:hypothetical protein